MKIVYTPQSREDLREIKDYISSVLKNPEAAKNITSKILKTAHILTEQPNSGISMQEKTGRETEYRCLISGNYGIFYIVLNNKIRIIRILDLRTDYLRSIFY